MKNNETLKLLSRYVNNKMSDEERNDFERQLERDPFLADACEGMSQMKFSLIEHDLHSIDINSGKHQVKWYKIASLLVAASVALVFVLYVFIPKTEINPESLTKNEFERSSIFYQKDTVLINNEADSMMDAGSDTTRVLLADLEPQKIDEKKLVVVSDEISLKREIIAQTEEEETAKNTDKNKDPIAPVAKVSRNILSESDTEVKHAVSSIPLVAKERSSLTEQIKSQVEVEEVERKMDNKQDAVQKRIGIHSNAQPLGGSSRFKAYVEESLRYPADVDRTKREVVRVKFEVSRTGNPQNFSIVRAPENGAFAKEAVRVIKEGPRWSPAVEDGVPIDEEYVLRIVFKPEK